MRKTYRVRYKRIDGYFGCVETSGEELTKEQAKNRVVDYLQANGIPYGEIDEVYEVEAKEAPCQAE